MTKSRDQVHSTTGGTAEHPFRWSVACGMPALSKLAGIPFHLLFYDIDAIIDAYRIGYPRARDLFGPHVTISEPGWAGISYGHVNTLGCELIFPEDSEVGTKPIYTSLTQGIEALRREVDFTTHGMFPFYLDLWEKLKQAFPEKNLAFGGFGVEGPITTAWILRGHGFFVDLHDHPELVKQFLTAVTESIISYVRCLRWVNAAPEYTSCATGMVDDVSAMIHPRLWPRLVIPFQETYFHRLGDGARSYHVEGLTIDHLKFIDELRIDSYDPSVSPRLTPAVIRAGCNADFCWLLNPMQLRDFSQDQVRIWLVDSVADGATSIQAHIERIACNEETAKKIEVFIRTSKQVQALLESGCSRNELRERMKCMS